MESRKLIQAATRRGLRKVKVFRNATLVRDVNKVEILTSVRILLFHVLKQSLRPARVLS